MSIGMSYDEFWHGDNYAYLYYLQAYKLKQKRDQYETDYRCWLTGMYTYEAICDASPILHDFAKKGTKPLRYPNEPFMVKQMEENKDKASKEKAIKNGRLAFRAQMDVWMRATQKKFTNKKKGGEDIDENIKT